METIINHPIRKSLNLSISEYCVLDEIYVLSHSIKFNGWCVANKKYIGEVLDLSKRTVHNHIDTLVKKGLIERNSSFTKLLRTTDEFNEIKSNKKDWVIALDGKESKFISGNINTKDATLQNLHPKCAKFAPTVQNLHPDSAKFAPQVCKICTQSVQNLHSKCAKFALPIKDIVKDIVKEEYSAFAFPEILKSVIQLAKEHGVLVEFGKRGWYDLARGYSEADIYRQVGAACQWIADNPKKVRDQTLRISRLLVFLKDCPRVLPVVPPGKTLSEVQCSSLNDSTQS